MPSSVLLTVSTVNDVVVNVVVVVVVVVTHALVNFKPFSLLIGRFLALGGLKLKAVCFFVPFGRPIGFLHATSLNGVVLEAEESRDTTAD